MALFLVSFLTISYAKNVASGQSSINYEKKPEFIDSRICAGCHQKQSEEWSDSHHDLAMQEATSETVLGDFNNSTFVNYGLKTEFYRRDDKFLVNTDGPDGELQEYEISYAFGNKPLQQYLIGFPGGRYQALDIAWDSRSKERGGGRWFHLHPDEKITSEDPLHWTGPFLNWNFTCAECHSTNLRKRYDFDTKTYQTSWSKIDVGCQACHGPGSNHVEWAESGGRESAGSSRGDTLGLVVELGDGNSKLEVELCARCHSRRTVVNDDYRYGKDFMDHYVPQLLLQPYYYPDGQIKDEVFVYGSFVQSKMFREGVSCSDCHNPHTAALRQKGNALCVRCHNSSPPKDFAALKPKKYDTTEHSFHMSGSVGSECINCHMPATNYMVVDKRRDHSFRIPRPDLTVKLSIPNACGGCHTDKPAEWASEKIGEWFPLSKKRVEGKTHFAEVIAAGQASEPEAASGLLELAEDETEPDIIRATAFSLLSRYRNKEPLDMMAKGLLEKSPLIRYEAVRGVSSVLGKAQGAGGDRLKFTLLTPLLTDKVRAVRTEAARVLTEVPASMFNKEAQNAFDKALDEFKERQYAALDRPESHLNLAVIYENMGQAVKAEDSYKTAIRLGTYFTPARFNLANFYNSRGRNEEAEQVFREIIKIVPESGEAYYSLGLLLAEMERFDDAAEPLAMASELMPDSSRVRYNYALVLQTTGNLKEAETELLKAHEISTADPNIVYALGIFYAQQSKWNEALPFAKRLAELLPRAPGTRQFLKHVRYELSLVKDGR